MNDLESSAERLPLSSAQLAVWRDLQIHPQDLTYGLSDYICLRGDIDLPRLLAAIRTVIASSTSFHLRFRGDGVRPTQDVAPSRAFEIPVIDLSQTSDPRAAALEWMRADHDRSHDMASGAMVRNAVLLIEPDVIYWYRNYHHLVADGFTFLLVGRWTAELYRASVAGQSPAQHIYGDYRDYVRQEVDYRRSEQFQVDQQFWRELHADLPLPVSLSVRSVLQATRRAVNSSDAWLPRTLLDGLQAVATDLNVGVGEFLIGTVALYLHLATGARDVPLCMPVHGRERGPTLSMTGMCTNLLPLRFRFDDAAMTIAQFLSEAAKHVKQAISHRRYRYEQLREDCGLARGEALPFRVHANVLRTGEQWVFNSVPVRVETTWAGPIDDLSLLIVESAGNREHFRLSMLSNPLLYEEWEIDGHKEYFARMLAQIAGNSRTPVAELSLLSESDRSRALTQWSHGKPLQLDSQCFHGLFERQAQRTPDAPAIEFEGSSISYAELDGRANQLAHHLRERGAGPDQIVGLCTDRSGDMIVGLLGIMKSGAAYLPIDPDLPSARISFMIEDAGTSLIVAQAAHEMVLPDHIAQVVFLDADRELLDRQPTSAPATEVQPQHLAYVIYTSGSTGLPKGVLIQHDSLCNLVVAQAEFLRVRPGARVLQFARFSFDVSISEIAMALLSGATLVMASKDALMPANLTRTVGDLGIEIISMPPSALPALNRGEVPSLEMIIVAGEACALELAREWFGTCRFINAYGPTEATVYATCVEYDGGDVLSIGRPLANVSTYILNERREPVSIGLAGELYIGGMGVARGYLNRPQLNAERFIADPIGGARLYRTGDRVRHRPDGSIEFLGRNDQQVKIRGFRIELGEIEAVLTAHASIAECAVLVRERGPRKQIVAYIVPRADSDTHHGQQLRAALRGKLPDYMTPSAFVFMTALPRTVSGKLDRRSLPDLDASALDRPLIEPRTPTERTLVDVWREALQLERISADDNFFDIGGDSLAALTIVTSVWHHFKLELAAQEIYAATSLAELAGRIDALRAMQAA